MDTGDLRVVRAFRGVAAGFWIVLALAVHSAAQMPKAPSALRFEVISFKHVGSVLDGGRWEGKVHYGRQKRSLKYEGVRLSGEVPLFGMLQFAFPLAGAGYCEAPDWMFKEWYQIEAIAPDGSTLEAARAMLQTALAERLGLTYRLVDKERRILALLRGSGDLKLTPSNEDEPDPGLHQRGVFRNRAASLAEFAGFLSGIAGTPVIDKTGITGRFRFDVDWSANIEPPDFLNPSLASDGAKKLGLKLEAGKEMNKWMVIDRANPNPTPN